MEIVFLLVALPWLILFDTIPKMFGYSGLTDWYIKEFGGYEDGSVIGNDNNTYYLPVRGMDKEGYIEILIDAKHIGYSGSFHRQSIKPFIGMKVEFVPNGKGYNYKIHTS